MSVVEYIFVFTFLGSIASMFGGIALLARERLMRQIAHFLASFSAGTLLGTAFFDLMPEVSSQTPHNPTYVFTWTLIGILFFFLLERCIHWFHHHEEDDTTHINKNTIPLLISGNTIHNFLDGMVIAATFLVSIPLGIITTLAVALHEIPHEIGDFGLLFHKGMEKKKIIWVNVLSACFSFLGAILVIIFGSIFDQYIPLFLSLTAGFFIFIATSDLIPEIRFETRKKHAVVEIAMLLLGVVFVYIAVSFLPQA